MDFAKKLLSKYGWKEGDGLGKNNDGIAKPLKASLKFDNAGLGADHSTDFTNHWWERLYNEATQNVEVKQTANGAVHMKAKDESVEINTKGYSVKKLRKAKDKSTGSDARYSNFLQSASLTRSDNHVEHTNKVEENDIAVAQFKVLTDEELFIACGGRTAHKGARHGLKLSGKLSRIEQQEREMLAKLQQRTKENGTPTLTVNETIKELKTKINEEKQIANEFNKLDSKKKKKRKSQELLTAEKDRVTQHSEDVHVICKKPKKSKKCAKEETKNEVEEQEGFEVLKKQKKSKRLKNREVQE